MATSLRKTDVVVIGLGAAGGVAVLPLTQAGLHVTALEAGEWLDVRDMVPDELKLNRGLWPPGPQKVQGEVPTVRANASSPTVRPSRHPMMNAVGGTSMHYMAQAWRLNPWDFGAVSEVTRRYGASRIPKGSTVEDWPFGYEELEPYYDKVEYGIGVSGKAGNIAGRKDERGNVFEGARSREYPMPPLRHAGFTDRMAEVARGLGWHPFPGPAAIASRPYEGRPGCVYHGYCLGAGCHVNAKSSTAVSTIPKAQATKQLTIVTGARVTSIESDGNGRVTGVRYMKGREEFVQPASAVLVASYTYENVRLLLLSRSKAYPNGLSNNHGQVGRHYFSHNQGGGVSAIFPFDLNVWYGTPGQGVNVDDWADDNFDHGALDFIGGGTLWVYTERRPMSAVNSVQAFRRGQRAWGSEWKAFVKENAGRVHGSYLQKTTLPYEDNYLDLDPIAKDPFGLPVIRITAEYKDNEKRIGRFIAAKMRQWYMDAGATMVQGDGDVGTAMGVSTHAYGGTRMGDNPETNVVDRWGFSHEAPNLGVLGGSVMGTSGARNPTLTAQALAWRTADHLVKNWKTIAG
ncbi:MAG TPA: GMC family oxidoreductase [Vicinamibacterales bacterium]|nr:GMC family oxidoreductase [Vicinamibacterales bacterium]